jgi:hypothetical protein
VGLAAARCLRIRLTWVTCLRTPEPDGSGLPAEHSRRAGDTDLALWSQEAQPGTWRRHGSDTGDRHDRARPSGAR